MYVYLDIFFAIVCSKRTTREDGYVCKKWRFHLPYNDILEGTISFQHYSIFQFLTELSALNAVVAV